MRRLLTGILVLAWLGVAASTQAAPAEDGSFGKKSLEYLSALDARGPREAGQKSERIAADYIVSQLASMGYSPQRQSFTEKVPGASRWTRISSQNVVCMKAGLSRKEVLVTAHYDSVTDGRGTDDNASGVALLLEMCQSLRDVTLPHTVRFVFFGAEEPGEMGSSYYVRTIRRGALDNILVVLNFDSLAAGDRLYAHGSAGSRGAAREWFLQKAEVMGIPLCRQAGRNPRYPAGTAGEWGDFVPFDRAGVPYVDFEATNWDLGDLDGYTQTDETRGENGRIWHTRFDTLEYIQRTFPGRIDEHLSAYARLLYAFLTEYN